MAAPRSLPVPNAAGSNTSNMQQDPVDVVALIYDGWYGTAPSKPARVSKYPENNLPRKPCHHLL